MLDGPALTLCGRPRRIAHRFAAAATAFLMLTPNLLAAPPENADPALASWYQSLRQPGTGISCCSVADCRSTEARISATAEYEALIDGTWLTVPSASILDRVDNPTGRAVVCYVPGRGILCFVRPSET
jgi:hypothetical protein